MSRQGRRFVVDPLPPEGGELWLPPDAAKHARTLRLEVGDAVRLFDGHGRQASGHIVAWQGSDVRCLVDAPTAEPTPTLHTTLVQVLPKAPKLDLIVRMATELDVQRIVLATSERAVPQPHGERSAAQLTRWQRIAAEAARQCERSTVPRIEAPQPLLAAAQAAAEPTGTEADSSWKVAFWEESSVPLLPPQPLPPRVCIVIGPEGGLSAREADALQALGYQMASLGPSLLRVETAGAVAITLVQARLGMR